MFFFLHRLTEEAYITKSIKPVMSVTGVTWLEIVPLFPLLVDLSYADNVAEVLDEGTGIGITGNINHCHRWLRPAPLENNRQVYPSLGSMCSLLN